VLLVWFRDPRRTMARKEGKQYVLGLGNRISVKKKGSKKLSDKKTSVYFFSFVLKFFFA
jgi:hypothetical protein